MKVELSDLDSHESFFKLFNLAHEEQLVDQLAFLTIEFLFLSQPLDRELFE